MRIRIVMTLAVAGAVLGLGRPLVAAPARETMERDGWTIGFAPADRELAARVLERLPEFEKQVAETEAQAFGFGPEQIEASASKLAALLARWCALPEREAEFRTEIERLLPPLRSFQTEVLNAFAVRALDLWRRNEVAESFRVGKPVAGLRWDEETEHPQWNAHFHWTLHGRDYTVRTKSTLPRVVPLPILDDVDQRAATDELVRVYDEWMNHLRVVRRGMTTAVVREVLSTAAAKVLRRECRDERASTWIAEGLARWAWREVALAEVPPKEREHYALVVAALPVRSASRQRVGLEDWPEGAHDDAALMARQVFCNIEEQHGVDAVPRLMREFWQLPREERTTAALKAVYRQVMGEALEARAPWRSLGAPTERAF